MLYQPRPVLQTGEDIGIKHIIADIVHGALACALSVLATMIMAVGLTVLPVLPVGQRPAAIRTFYQPGKNLCRTVLALPAAASLYRGYLSCFPSIFLSAAVLPEKASCLVVASCVSLVSPQAAKLTCSAAPPLPTKPYGFAGAPTIAACSGVGTLPATSGHFVPKSGSLRCFPSRGIPFRTVILFSRCCPSMNYPKSTRKKCNPRNFARIAF